ncbi:MAG: MoaD/ThiS family protein [Phycisphaerae bacterium]
MLAFGSAAGVLGWSARYIPVASETSLATIVARLERECPRLVEARGRIRFAVNRAYATPESLLRAGDELAIIPPVSGG